MKAIVAGVTEIGGYRIIEFIGGGGMGNVYKVLHLRTQQVAAMKVLHHPEMAERFRNEAYIQSSVHHPNIAQLYAFLEPESIPCIVMELVEGECLDAYMKRRGRLSAGEVERVALQIAQALAYLHQQGITHRDIKPQNFKIRPDGRIVMLDFGIAKNRYSPKLTQNGFIVGTTEYMAPEALQQKPEQKSDVWSFGVLLYEMSTGYLPFEQPNQAALRSKILDGQYTSPALLVPTISPTLLQAIEMCLQPQPGKRASAETITGILSRQSQAQGKKSALINRKPGIKTIIGIAAVCMVFILLVIVAHHSPSPEAGNDTTGDTLGPVTTERHVRITTPSIEQARLILPDGSSRALPCELSGRPGENITFTIQAAGYHDRHVEFEINDRRSSYEYNLEKKTND